MKLPHWLQLALALAVVVVAWVVQQTQSGALVLPAAAITALTLVQSILGILSPSALPEANIRAAARAQAALKVVGGILLLCALGASQQACTPATAPVWSQIEQTVLQDLENGVALEAIEAAVTAIDPALAATAGAVDQVIQDAITLLVDTGVLPAPTQTRALAMQTQIAGKLAAVKGH